MTSTTPLDSNPLNPNPNNKPMVSMHYPRLVARVIHLKERELDKLLAGTGIRIAEFMDEEALLTTDQVVTISLNAISMTQDLALGLKVGRALSPETYGPLGFLVSASPNLKVAIEHFQRLLPARIPFVKLTTEPAPGGMLCKLAMQFTDNPTMCRAGMDAIVVSLTAIAASMNGDDLADMQLQFAGSEAPYSRQYADYLPFAITYNSNADTLFIPERLLQTPNPIASKANYQLAMQQCQTMLQSLAKEHTSTTNRVKEILLSAPPGTINEVEVARSLFVSKRTLARRLTSEGTTFQKIRDQILADIASLHLRQTRDTVEAIAALLNYHDASNFRRAFKRWFGQTPEQFRQELH